MLAVVTFACTKTLARMGCCGRGQHAEGGPAALRPAGLNSWPTHDPLPHRSPARQTLHPQIIGSQAEQDGLVSLAASGRTLGKWPCDALCRDNLEYKSAEPGRGRNA